MGKLGALWRAATTWYVSLVVLAALGALADQVRELPRAPFLRPLGELFVAAVEQEDEAFRALRNTWRPFDSVVFEVFDDERTEVNRLRRQVAAGAEDLLPRFAISVEEVESGAGR